MKLARHRRTTPLGISMTPMIDIVFLLIIFFMIVNQMEATERAQPRDFPPVELPAVQQGGQSLETISITFNLDASGRIIIAGKQYSLDQAIAATRRELERVGRRAENLHILIRADRRCSGRHVNDLVQSIEELGISQIRLAVKNQ